ncbi:MAG: tetratricopeptide repeat protein [Duncaniella sp.]|nr:tetratricopeptide repeat protein [Duncaniella sp.]
MDTINTIDIEVRGHLAARRVYEAAEVLRNAALAAGAHRALDRVARAEENYALLSKYALDGVEDPQRQRLLDDIKAELYATALEIKRERLLPTESTLYFNTVRTLDRRREAESLAGLMAEYRRLTGDISLAVMAGEVPEASVRRREELESALFMHIWTAYPLQAEVSGLIREAIADATLPGYFKEMITGAVFMGLDSWPDEARVMLLADIYASAANERVEMRALTSLLLGLWIHRDALYSSRLANRLAALRDTRPEVDADLRDALMQIIRTRDTDRVTRKITDEVIPEMMKLRPDIEKNMRSNPEGMIDPEANPEWEEMLEKSGVASRLRELQEMQEEGADVMMSTFGNLKTFPWFNDIAHWFTPFHADVSLFAGDKMAAVIEAAPLFCDNDKYSFMLSLGHIPAAQRQMMEGQIDAYAVQSGMMAAGEATTARDRRSAIARNYTRDLYRFFKLFRRKGEFTDPFLSPVNPLRVPLTGDSLVNSDLLSLIGEFYFKNRYWAEAADMLGNLAALTAPTIPLLQKTGYAFQQLKQWDRALEAYRRAEMLGDTSRWIMRRMAATLRSTGRYEEALEYLKRIEAEEPDDLKLALTTGRTLMKLRRYDEALKYFYKVDYLTPGKADRHISWASFMTDNYEKASAVMDKILADNNALTVNDRLNAGHLSLVTGNRRAAAGHYADAIAALDFDFDRFMIQFAADRDVLREKGVDAETEGIVLDEARRLSRTMINH